MKLYKYNIRFHTSHDVPYASPQVDSVLKGHGYKFSIKIDSSDEGYDSSTNDLMHLTLLNSPLLPKHISDLKKVVGEYGSVAGFDLRLEEIKVVDSSEAKKFKEEAKKYME